MTSFTMIGNPGTVMPSSAGVALRVRRGTGMSGNAQHLSDVSRERSFRGWGLECIAEAGVGNVIPALFVPTYAQLPTVDVLTVKPVQIQTCIPPSPLERSP